MPIKTDMRGLKKLQSNLSELGKLSSVTLGELMNDEFMSRYTSYPNLNDMFDASGFLIDTLEDFKAIPDDEWEAFIVNNTSFSSWEEMQRKSHEEFLHKKVLKGL
ncbi:hypothetical protein EXT42_01590 [Pseudoalteromonas sp. CO302Y]|uniref:hypothetical protein n=1 Tax=unclassified Pseudoalteromonas TaxID=194690 RepID=UPI00102323AC|nr:hypothetical protein EXT42_01590 [Pseudoalteromonas sp. CO302Y]RZG11090.1 hypothetical protein EXT40_01590 [Pseudoalteromonas sp. CO133X]